MHALILVEQVRCGDMFPHCHVRSLGKVSTSYQRTCHALTVEDSSLPGSFLGLQSLSVV